PPPRPAAHGAAADRSRPYTTRRHAQGPLVHTARPGAPPLKRAVILAGGEGTRLRPYTTVLPKPLMPIGDRPVLDIVVRQLKAHGFGGTAMATGHLAELIEAFFRDGSGYGIPVDYYREMEPLGTVGALALIEGLS